MPRQRRLDVVIVDRSVLAQNMYQLLLANSSAFLPTFVDQPPDRLRMSPRLRPDLLIVNSNTLPREGGDELRFSGPIILLVSPDRLDLKERYGEQKNVILIDKPFYPYDLLSVLNRLRKESLEKGKKGKRQAVRRGRKGRAA